MIDEKDLKIIKLLQENSRIPYTELAKKVGISDVAVIKRIKKLEKQGVIKKYTIVIDPKKLGYNSVSIVGINVKPEYLFPVISHLKEKNYVKYLALSSGDHTLMAIIWARNGSKLAKIHNEISKLPGVTKVCPSIILDVIKENDIFS